MKVKQHKREGKCVREHNRKSAAWKKLHPRYKMWGVRPTSCMDMSELLNKKHIYEKELNKIVSGGYSWVQEGHEAFIRRRLKAAIVAIKIKQKSN